MQEFLLAWLSLIVPLSLILTGAGGMLLRLATSQRFVARVKPRTAEAIELQAKRDELFRQVQLAEIAVSVENDERASFAERVTTWLREHKGDLIVNIVAAVVVAVLLAVLGLVWFALRSLLGL